MQIPKEQRNKALAPGAIDVLCVIPRSEVMTKGIAYVKAIIRSDSAQWTRFWKYFTRTWNSTFPVNTWNIHGESKINNRTNNPLERYNRTIGESFPNAHPSLVNFVETVKVQSEEYLRKIDLIKKGIDESPLHQQVSFEIPKAYLEFAFDFNSVESELKGCDDDDDVIYVGSKKGASLSRKYGELVTNSRKSMEPRENTAPKQGMKRVRSKSILNVKC